MLIMTNIETHGAIVEFFAKKDYFGGRKDSFIFFPQAMLPTIDAEGKILL